VSALEDMVFGCYVVFLYVEVVVWYFLAGDFCRRHSCLRWSLYDLLNNLRCVVFLIAVLVVYL
jgi:hypothetical protein